MAGNRALTQHYPPRLRELIVRGEARPAQRRLRDVLTQIGPRQGPIGRAGTRALQEQREDRV